jgi:hypothetical protein
MTTSTHSAASAARTGHATRTPNTASAAAHAHLHAPLRAPHAAHTQGMTPYDTVSERARWHSFIRVARRLSPGGPV